MLTIMFLGRILLFILHLEFRVCRSTCRVKSTGCLTRMGWMN